MKRWTLMAMMMCATLWLGACVAEDAAPDEDLGEEAGAAPDREARALETDTDYFDDETFSEQVGSRWKFCDGFFGKTGNTSTKFYMKTQTGCSPPYTTTIRCYANNQQVACPGT